MKNLTYSLVILFFLGMALPVEVIANPVAIGIECENCDKSKKCDNKCKKGDKSKCCTAAKAKKECSQKAETQKGKTCTKTAAKSKKGCCKKSSSSSAKTSNKKEEKPN